MIKKKLIGTKMKIFMVILLVSSIIFYTIALIQLNNSGFMVSDYFDLSDYHFTNWISKSRSSLNGEEILSKNIDLKDIDNLNIDFTNNYAIIESYPGDKLSVSAYSTYYSKTINEAIDILSNSVDNKNLYISPNENLATTKEYKNNIGFLIKIPYSYINSTNININYGNISLDNLTLKNMNVKTSNADISLNNVTSETSSISSTYGNLISNKFISQKAIFNNIHGDISSTETTGDTTISTVNGNISILASSSLNNLDIDTNYGNINLSLPENSNISLNYLTVNGSFYKTHDNTNENSKNVILNFGDGSGKINIKTVDGDLILSN